MSILSIDKITSLTATINTYSHSLAFDISRTQNKSIILTISVQHFSQKMDINTVWLSPGDLFQVFHQGKDLNAIL